MDKSAVGLHHDIGAGGWNFYEISQDIVVLDFQGMDTGLGGVFGLQCGNRFLGPVGQSPHMVQRRVKPIADNPAIAEKCRQFIT